MVSFRALILSLLTVTSLASASGCGVFKWGEAPPPPKSERFPQNPGIVPEPITVLSGTEPESLAALEYWTNEASTIWDDIQGQRRNQLTEDEIATLIRRRMIKFSGDPEKWIKRVISIKRLLGFPDSVTRESVLSFINWVKKSRELLRNFYSRFFTDQQATWRYADLRNLVRIFSSLLKRGGSTLTPTQLSELVQPLLPESNRYLGPAAEPLARITVNALASLCGRTVDQRNWNGVRISECLDRLIDHFQPLEPYMDFWLGAHGLNGRSATQTLALNESMRQFASLVKRWISESDRPGLDLDLWRELAESLELKVPPGTLGFLNWIPRFSERSTPDRIHPEALIILAQAYEDADWAVLGSAQAFQNCGPDWRTCHVDVEVLRGLRKTIPAVDRFWRIRNPKYATEAIPMSGANYRYMMWLNSLAAKIIKAFDRDRDGFIEVQPDDDANEVLVLMANAMQFVDSRTFFDNMWKRLNSRPISNIGAGEILRPYRLPGLTELITLIAELLPKRDNHEDLRSERPLDFFIGGAGRQAIRIDHIGLTSAMWAVSTIGKLEEAYLSDGLEVRTADSGLRYVNRKSVVKALPRLIKKHFPRIHRSCLEVGFAESCGVFFTELVSGVEEGTTDIRDIDLDLVSVSAMVLEGLMEKCDKNGDETWSAHLGVGYDELDCTFTTLKAAVDRLMKSQVIENSPSARTALSLINSNGITRILGKVAVARGSARALIVHGTILAPFHRSGNLGTLLQLGSEIMDPERLKAVRAGSGTGPVDPRNLGDELVYDPEWFE